MKYLVQPNEIAGFIHFFSSTTPEQKDVWMDKYPELKETDFENLIVLMVKNKKKSGPTISDSMLHDYIDKINSLDDLKKMLDSYPGKDIDINKVKQILDSIWPIYDKFYQEQVGKLNSMSNQASTFMNQEAVKPLESVAKFYNCEIPKDYTISTYIYPVATTETDSHQRGGRNKKSGEFLWFSDNLLKKDNPKATFSIIFHEATHNIFRKSGEYDKSLSYWGENSPVVQFFKKNPHLKLKQNFSDKDATQGLLNEALTTAFQGIFERDVLKQKRKILYDNPVVNIMAHKMIPVLETALKNGETFGPEFLKKFEKEFETAIPEMLNTMDNILIKFGPEDKDKISIAELRRMKASERKALLRENEGKWEAINKLYKMNEKEHLFDDFSYPPILDLVTPISEKDKKRGKGGNYNPESNTIIVEEGKTTDLTTATVAHELKHAQQMRGDMYKIFTGKIKKTPRETLELKFLTEAQAFAFGSYVYYKASNGNTNFMGLTEENEKDREAYKSIENVFTSNKDALYNDIEGKLINAWLDVLYEGKVMGYRNNFLRGNSLDPQDKTLTHIPESFHLSESVSQKKLLAKLAQAPLTPTNTSLLKRLPKAVKEGEDDSRNETKTTQQSTEKKSSFPKWLQNPNWLWHRKQKGKR